MAAAARLRPLLRRARRLHEPPPPAPPGRGQPRGRRRRVPRGLLPHRRPDRPGHRDDARGQGVRPDASRSSSTSPTSPCTRRCSAKAEDIASHAGAYDAGWDVIRERRHARQIELGVIARGHRCRPATPSPATTCRRGTTWTRTAKRSTRGYMEVYAAMVDSIDQNVGRLLDRARGAGRVDNTIFVFTSDNGGSREGEAEGTSAYLRSLHFGVWASTSPSRRTCRGSTGSAADRPTPHYPRGWAMASNTPFRLYKINTHLGGHSVPFVALARRRCPRRRAARPVRARHRPAADGARDLWRRTSRDRRASRCSRSTARTSARRCWTRARPGASATWSSRTTATAGYRRATGRW